MASVFKCMACCPVLQRHRKSKLKQARKKLRAAGASVLDMFLGGYQPHAYGQTGYLWMGLCPGWAWVGGLPSTTCGSHQPDSLVLR